GLFLLLISIISCEKENYEFGELVTPTNMVITTDIVGVDAAHPNGDGSGTVHFNVVADGALTYRFVYDGAETTSAFGTKTYTFGTTGLKKYAVTVLAYGTGGVSSSKTVEVEVLVVYSPPADLLTMLTSNSSRTWRLKAEATGHFGVGPADSATPVWWAAVPNDKVAFGAYDDRFIFNVNGTFTHNTNGDTFGKLAAMAADLGGDQGLTPDGNGESVFALANYSESWNLSAPGGQETLTFSNIGYHGFYVGGDHKYAILARSENEMSIRTVGADGNGWFAILIAVE
ncbi:MAG: glucan endo-1,3-beta-D-glucosidase, partial [Gelidibacter sp.]|nr:glucan endo-1,3-beta-D-glucosidase [Gelidibacter sp.]